MARVEVFKTTCFLYDKKLADILPGNIDGGETEAKYSFLLDSVESYREKSDDNGIIPDRIVVCFKSGDRCEIKESYGYFEKVMDDFIRINNQQK